MCSKQPGSYSGRQREGASLVLLSPSMDAIIQKKYMQEHQKHSHDQVMTVNFFNTLKSAAVTPSGGRQKSEKGHSSIKSAVTLYITLS